MAKFKSIPHEVTAVQWKGEITEELRALFGSRPLSVNTDPLGLLRPTLVVPQEGDHLAGVGDWVVRTDYSEELGFDLEVMESDDFSETYEVAEESRPVSLDFTFDIPAKMTTVSESDTQVRFRLGGFRGSRDILALCRQLQMAPDDVSVPSVPVTTVTKAAGRIGLDLNCKSCGLAVFGDGSAMAHDATCQTIEAIRTRLG